MNFTCIQCEGEFDTRHPLHKVPSKRGKCGNCYTEEEPNEGRYIMVTEGTGSSKGYVSWHRKPREGGDHVSGSILNHHTNFTQRYQAIGNSKRRR